MLRLLPTELAWYLCYHYNNYLSPVHFTPHPIPTLFCIVITVELFIGSSAVLARSSELAGHARRHHLTSHTTRTSFHSVTCGWRVILVDSFVGSPPALLLPPLPPPVLELYVNYHSSRCYLPPSRIIIHSPSLIPIAIPMELSMGRQVVLVLLSNGSSIH